MAAVRSRLAWAERIEDEFIRRRSLQVATDVWVRSDPAGAAAWAAGENVSAPLRERIRRGIAEERRAVPGVVPDVSLGNLISDAEGTVGTDLSYLILFPGLMLFLVVLCVNFVGDGLRDALDPRAVR